MLTFTILLRGIALGLFSIVTLGGLFFGIIAVIASSKESEERRHYDREP